jgi:hypothetical protein
MNESNAIKPLRGEEHSEFKQFSGRHQECTNAFASEINSIREKSAVPGRSDHPDLHQRGQAEEKHLPNLSITPSPEHAHSGEPGGLDHLHHSANTRGTETLNIAHHSRGADHLHGSTHLHSSEHLHLSTHLHGSEHLHGSTHLQGSEHLRGSHHPHGEGHGSALHGGPAAPSRTGFGENLLHRIGAPVTKANLTFLDAWQRAEGGSADNPFNTTQHARGSHRYNSADVQRYPSIATGIEATVRTLENGLYNGVLRALHLGTNPHAAADAVSRTPWGTGLGISRLLR